MNVWIAVRNETTVTPARTSAAGFRPPAAAAPSDVGERDAERGAEERREREQVVRARRAACVGDRDRRSEPGAGSDAEQVGVDERVAEDALVGAAGEGEHPADEQAEHDARGAELPEDGRVGRREVRLHPEQRHVREDARGRSRSKPMPAGPTNSPTSTGQDDERDRDRPPVRARADAEGTRTASPSATRRRCDAHFFAISFTFAATSRTKSTTRGPQREAMSSSTAEHAAVLDRRDRPPAGALVDLRDRLPAADGVGEDDQLRVGRDDVLLGELRVARSRSCRPRRRCPSGRASCRSGR